MAHVDDPQPYFKDPQFYCTCGFFHLKGEAPLDSTKCPGCGADLLVREYSPTFTQPQGPPGPGQLGFSVKEDIKTIDKFGGGR